MEQLHQQAEAAVRVGASAGPRDLVGEWRKNLAVSGLNPRKATVGFVVGWCLFFFVLYGMPAPEGLTAPGKATLAVMAWACTM